MKGYLQVMQKSYSEVTGNKLRFNAMQNVHHSAWSIKKGKILVKGIHRRQDRTLISSERRNNFVQQMTNKRQANVDLQNGLNPQSLTENHEP